MIKWWKILSVLLISYAIIGGFMMPAPDDLGILGKTIRNLHFHVPMWFTMIALLLASYIYSIRSLRHLNPKDDLNSSALINTAILFGFLGVSTGSFWAYNTWGYFWINDPKLNGVAIGMLIYIAYYILRKSIDDDMNRAKFTAVYNLFAFPIFIVLIIVLPRMAENSLHPGSGDTVGFNNYDLDDDLRKVFYPSVLGWILFGFWVAELRNRVSMIRYRKEELELNKNEE